MFSPANALPIFDLARTNEAIVQCTDGPDAPVEVGARD